MPGTLLTSTNCTSHIHLIISPSTTNPLVSSRANKSLSLGAKIILIAPPEDDSKTPIHSGLKEKVDLGEVNWISRGFQDEDLTTLGREAVGNVVDAVFVVVKVGNQSEVELATHISQLCRGPLRIPINVTDCPALCSFSLLSTHVDGPLQIGVTTTGMGCKLANRIRRELAGGLPSGLGEACQKLGELRRRIWEEDLLSITSGQGMNGAGSSIVAGFVDGEEADEDEGQRFTFNKLIPYNFTSEEDYEIAKSRRIRWLSQVCEYWPLSKLCELSDLDMERVLASYLTSPAKAPELSNTSNGALKKEPEPQSSAPEDTDLPPLPAPLQKKGTIHLLGAGTGHTSLLTLATYQTLQSADLVLSDKLVPAPVLALVPRRTQLHIARKFPGNADKAQSELLQLGLEALKEGKKVVRLKQGDPYLYGRGGEEVLFFRQHGHEPYVVPGITSALSGALCAGIPVTHRSVADEVVICTGTGTGGVNGSVPSYRKSRTVVWLMALHRLKSLVDSITDTEDASVTNGRPYPKDLPCAVVERASCPDQRVIRTTLRYVCDAVEEQGSRPPGLLVAGWACEVLNKPTEGKKWVVEEGFRGLE